MDLILKNFKCFREAEFYFDTNNITLINARSGFGKTTIFDAIKFVLWGNRDSDIITFNKKKCEVILKYRGYTFRRTKNPNFFTIYSDKLTIANPDEFISKHFVKYPNNFVMLQSTKKMEILEKICENKFNIDELKEKLKIYIHNGNYKIKEIKNYIDIYNNIINNIEFQENINKPLEITDDIPNFENKLNELKKEYKYKLLANEKYKNINEEIKKLENFLNKNQIENPKEILDKINSIKFEQRRILNQMKKIYIPDTNITQRIKENIEIKNKINNLDLFKFKINNLKAKISSIWSKSNDSRIYSLAEIKKILDQYSGNKGIYQCPNCECFLDIKDNILIKSDYHINYNFLSEIYILENKLKNLDIELNKLLKLEKIYILNEEYLSNINKLEKYNEKIKELDIQLKSIPFYGEDKLLDNIILSKLSLDKLNTEIKNLQNYTDIESIESNIINLENNYIKYINYLHNEKQKNIYNENMNKIIIYEKNLNSYINTVEKIEKIKKIVEVSQSESIKIILDFINNEVNKILDVFFEENIIIQFKNINKLGKPQIDINIIYKNNNIKISTLSSGELARLSIAVDIIIYKLTNTECPLLLDEIAANLDSDISTDIFNFIKQYFNNEKTIFVIAHQTVEGIFDNVINEKFLNKFSRRI